MANRNITLSLPEELVRKAKVIAAERDTSVSALVAELVEHLAHEVGHLGLHLLFPALAAALLQQGAAAAARALAYRSPPEPRSRSRRRDPTSPWSRRA